MAKFYDKNGLEISVGDYVVPDEGRELHIVSEGKCEDFPDEVLFGQQVEDMRAFSILTQENLSEQWSKKVD